MGETKMIGIDFTWIDLNGKLTNSLEFFTCDLLDCIADQNQQKNFVIITHPMTEKVIQNRFSMFRVYGIGGWGLRLLYHIASKNGVKFIKNNGIYDFLLRIHGIKKLWIPVLVPHNVRNIKTDYIGTCHDLMTMNEFDNKANYKAIFERANLIVTISNFVKNQIIDQYDITSDKITVIPNSIYISNDDAATEEVLSLKGKKFLLDCNAYDARKNTLVMIKAFERIMDKIPEDLVLCGGYKTSDGYFDSCTQYITEHDLSDRIHIFLGIDEKQKNWLFQNCSIFITPSENEGFGRTPVEAALFLKPVISTRATSLEEATCGMVHYIEDPRDDEELAKAIVKLLANPDSPERLMEIKNVFAQKYCAEAMVKEYMKVFGITTA